MSDEHQECWTVLFGGRVQGVGFRYNTHNLARRFHVTGFVRNLPDGQVELMAEGAVSELDQFIEAIKQTMTGNIRSVTIQTAQVTGQFQGFRIRY